MHKENVKSGFSRRRFILQTLGAGVVGGLGIAGYSFAIEPHLLKIKDYHLQTPKWHSDKPLRVAVAADFHVGCPSVNLSNLESIVEKINALQADCILLLGDFLISGVLLGKKIKPKPIANVLAKLKAPLGVYAVLGNHDWWEDGQGMWQALENAEIKVLENDAILIQSNENDKFWIAGLADDSTRTPDIPATMKKIVTEDPVIIMTHDPATFLTKNERPVVTLAGHTHGGQIAPPLWGPIVIPGRAPLKYAYGHIIENDCDLIVSCGIGTSILPVRFNRKPEIINLIISAIAN